MAAVAAVVVVLDAAVAVAAAAGTPKLVKRISTYGKHLRTALWAGASDVGGRTTVQWAAQLRRWARLAATKRWRRLASHQRQQMGAQWLLLGGLMRR